MKYGKKYGASKTKPLMKGGKGINLKESRLNSGGDEKYKGKRGSIKTTTGSMSYGGGMKY